MYGVGARNSPISVQLPDRPQRTLLIPEAELKRPRDRDRQSERQGEKTSEPDAYRDATSNAHVCPAL